MSGGVDSAVAAALLCRQGYEVHGFTMRLGSSHGDWEASRACCGLSEVHDARRVADRLGIPHHVLNHGAEFERLVIADFVAEYTRGRTPNPCIRCNQHIKFATFLEQAQALGCDCIATGHYAQAQWQAAAGRWELRRGRDAAKDQSYVLYPLTQPQLALARFPLGAYTKPQIRELATALGLPVAAKPESQEICFVAAGQHAEFVRRQAPQAVRPGPIVDLAGTVLGQHQGLPGFTIGQRHGLGLATGERLFVVELRADRNEVVVAPTAATGRRRCQVEAWHWVSAAPHPAGRAAAQLRAHMAPVAVRYEVTGSSAELTFDEPLRGIAPGQAAVLYDGEDRVLAGGVIAAVPLEGSVS
ncbi:MAG: tRNA 2-thiouridine(34) synthase MnmA [Fimbriimonadaceae bacterium]|nr:tRNA 2-thiouridine(34) synthase MnmA [Fimbriimonadaceae bacterium]